MAVLFAAAAAVTAGLAQVPGYGVPNYTVTYQMNRSTVVRRIVCARERATRPLWINQSLSNLLQLATVLEAL